MKYCNFCNKTFNIDKARFCPYCGQKSIKTFNFRDFIPVQEIVVIYGSKDTKNYIDIRNKLSVNQSFLEFVIGDSNYATVSSTTEKINTLFPYIGLSYGMKIYENNKIMRTNAALYNSILCVNERNKASDPEKYCYGIENSKNKQPNIVGCQQMPCSLVPYSPIYIYGNWKDETKYIFDKFKLSRQIEKTINNYRFCPFLQQDIIKNFLVLWPNEVNILFDLQWDYWPPNKMLDDLINTANLNFDGNATTPNFPQFTNKYPTISNPEILEKISRTLYENKTIPIAAQEAVFELKNMIHEMF